MELQLQLQVPTCGAEVQKQLTEGGPVQQRDDPSRVRRTQVNPHDQTEAESEQRLTMHRIPRRSAAAVADHEPGPP